MKKIIFILTMLFPFSAYAWDGYDSINGDSVTIEENTLVRPGETIDIYNNSDGEYQSVDIIDIYDSGTSTTVETFNYSTGETQFLEMDSYWHFPNFVAFSPHGARNTKLGGQRHPIAWLFLCPFAKVKTLFDCGFLLYLHLLDAGCARYVQGFGLKAGSRS